MYRIRNGEGGNWLLVNHKSDILKYASDVILLLSEKNEWWNREYLSAVIHLYRCEQRKLKLYETILSARLYLTLANEVV